MTCGHEDGGREELIEKVTGGDLLCLHAVQAEDEAGDQVLKLGTRGGAPAR